MKSDYQEADMAAITAAVAKQFRSFGGGNKTPGNIFSDALKDVPATFAAGIDIAAVVKFVLKDVP